MGIKEKHPSFFQLSRFKSHICSQNKSKTIKMWLTPELQEHLVYWNNPLETGVVFGSVLVLMVAVKYMSLISVVANLGLALVTSTVAFRIYKSVLSAVKKTDDTGHPFKKYLDIDTTLSTDKVLDLTNSLVTKLNALLKKLKSVFLVEDFVESLKFGVAMYMLTCWTDHQRINNTNPHLGINILSSTNLQRQPSKN